MNAISLMCERARRWASLRVDDELSQLESALLDAHLASCAGCRAFADGAAAVASALANARPEQPQLRVVVPRSARRSWALRTASAGAAVAAAVTGILVVGSSGHGTSTEASKPVAMVSAVESPNELRILRRPGLIDATRPVPRNRQVPGES